MFPRLLQQGNYLLALHAGKSFEKFFNRIPRLQVIEEALHWHTRSREHQLATQNLRIMAHDIHGCSLTEEAVNCQCGSRQQRLPRAGIRHGVTEI